MRLGLPLFLVCLFAWCALPASTRAEVSKEACLESHSRGQDAREQGKLTLARKLFMTCAQPACPALVQNDCARFADDIERYQPWLTFAARDSEGHDLPDTTVYLDGVLVVTRLDDGKPHEVDPGRHTVRFEYGDQQETITVVVGSGEKGRPVVATFRTQATRISTEHQTEPTATPARPIGPKILLGAGAALLVGGAALGVIGLSQVPSTCSTSSHECTAAPGDPVFDDAAASMRLSNIGWAVGAVGLGTLTAGLIWYFKSAKDSTDETQLAPLLSPDSAGLSIRGRL